MTLPYDECRLNLVPEDSVIPETQTLVILNGRKGFVGILFIYLINKGQVNGPDKDRIKKRKSGECLEER